MHKCERAESGVILVSGGLGALSLRHSCLAAAVGRGDSLKHLRSHLCLLHTHHFS